MHLLVPVSSRSPPKQIGSPTRRGGRGSGGAGPAYRVGPLRSGLVGPTQTWLGPTPFPTQLQLQLHQEEATTTSNHSSPLTTWENYKFRHTFTAPLALQQGSVCMCTLHSRESIEWMNFASKLCRSHKIWQNFGLIGDPDQHKHRVFFLDINLGSTVQKLEQYVPCGVEFT